MIIVNSLYKRFDVRGDCKVHRVKCSGLENGYFRHRKPCRSISNQIHVQFIYSYKSYVKMIILHVKHNNVACLDNCDACK